MEDNRPTTPCEICGTPTPMCMTKRCNNCWELERRLLYADRRVRLYFLNMLMNMD